MQTGKHACADAGVTDERVVHVTEADTKMVTVTKPPAVTTEIIHSTTRQVAEGTTTAEPADPPPVVTAAADSRGPAIALAAGAFALVALV